MRYFFCLLIIAIIFLSCDNNKEIEHLLNSENATQIIKGCSKIDNENDTIFISLILNNPYDIRISHDYRFKGLTVHKAKIRAMERISGLKPPNQVTFSADTANVEFYKKWAKDQGYIP